MKRLAFLFWIFLAPAFVASAGGGNLFEITATKFLLGTQVDIIAMAPQVARGKQACYLAFKEIERIEQRFSSHLPNSEISSINQSPGKPVKVSYETFALLLRAKKYSQNFNGDFDVSIGPLTRLWGFNDDQKITLPDSSRLAALLQFVDYQKILLNARDTTVTLARRGMRLDLGGIAKGYAIDRAAKILREQEIENFLINAGGDIYAAGVKAPGRKWAIGIKHPRRLEALIARFELQDYAVATSGDYERFAIINGKRYHHILNPKTGYPAKLNQSVTVLAPTAEEADVWATYLFILGYSRYKQKFPHSPVEALFVDAAGKLHYDTSLVQHYAFEFLQ
ncbi:MAG: FAD:protein FMN transferase [Calditrichaeota bacterium]|nr:MAG: FAD:protein FMN transferase [Calditrichota bacterium]